MPAHPDQEAGPQQTGGGPRPQGPFWPPLPALGDGITPLLATYIITEIFRHENPSMDPMPKPHGSAVVSSACLFLFSLAGIYFKPTPDVVLFRPIFFFSQTENKSGLRTLLVRMIWGLLP